MLLFLVLSNLMCLLLGLTSAHATTPEDSVNLAAHHVRRLPTPLKNLLRRRDAIVSAGTPNLYNAFALNSTNGEVADNTPFEAQIDIPGLGRLVYFFVKGEIDSDYSVTVEFWVHYLVDTRIGVYLGDLVKGVDMKIPDSIKTINGEARIYVVATAGYDLLIFEAYGSFLPSGPTNIPVFKREIKRWKVGVLNSIQDVPNSSGVQALSNDADVDAS